MSLRSRPDTRSFEVRTPEETDQCVSLYDAEDRLRRLHAEYGEARRLSARRPYPPSKIASSIGVQSSDPAKPSRHQSLEAALGGSVSTLALRSVVWTLARALVAAVAYALVIYSDTWGSVTDFASAFTAGFLTETLVNWAVMPAFRTNRNRARAAPPATQARDDTPTESAAQADPPSLNQRSPATRCDRVDRSHPSRQQPVTEDHDRQPQEHVANRATSEYPFGTPDGARADIREIMDGFVGIEDAGVDLGDPAEDLTPRIIVGRMGSGKTLYLRRSQAFAAGDPSTYADDVRSDLPSTQDVIQRAIGA